MLGEVGVKRLYERFAELVAGAFRTAGRVAGLAGSPRTEPLRGRAFIGHERLRCFALRRRALAAALVECAHQRPPGELAEADALALRNGFGLSPQFPWDVRRNAGGVASPAIVEGGLLKHGRESAPGSRR